MATNSQLDRHLKIEMVKINKLRFAEYNPRRISKYQEDHLDASIHQHGITQPLLANSNPDRLFILIAGHQRLRSARRLGYTEVPTMLLNLSEDEERSLNLKLNRIGGEFEEELLKLYPIEQLLAAGFDDLDLGQIWDADLTIEDDNFDEEKAVKEAATTDIKLGDRFRLGKHALICGDANDPDVIKRLVGDLKPNMLYADPIFNISLDYNRGVGNKSSYGGQTNDNKTDAEYSDFLGKALTNALAVMDKDIHVFLYCDQTYIGLLQTLMKQHGLTNRRVCLWVKNGFSPVPEVAFNKSYEACVYSTRGKPYLSDIHNLTEILNKDIAAGNRAIDDIIDIFDIWLAKRDPGQDYQHPTQKPLSLHQKPLKRCTKIGDVVLDYYGGSGSTLLACEQMKRVALLCEIEPIFCQVICDRYSALTGDKAVKL